MRSQLIPEQRDGHLFRPKVYIPIITVKRLLLLFDNNHIIVQNYF